MTAPADAERRQIRDAMDRLLDGKPVRSDGKLTVKSLAAEAGVKRWVLTHKHPDLQDEFRSRVQAQDSTPAAMKDLLAKHEDTQKRLERVMADLRQADAELKRYARVVQVLTLENEQLRTELSRPDSNVRALPGRKRRA